MKTNHSDRIAQAAGSGKASAPQAPSRRRLLGWCAGLAGVGIAAAAGARAALELPVFGGSPSHKRIARILASPNWKDSAFRNLVPVPVTTSDKSTAQALFSFLTEDRSALEPRRPLPAKPVNFAGLEPDSLLWFGHSSFYLQKAGLRIAADPVFGDASPIPGIGRPYRTTHPMSASMLPELDVLLITHDHYDHLEYETIRTIAGRTRRAICPLGVGAHLERWGMAPERITELDWWESVRIGETEFTLTPSQHFSGRTLKRNLTLWGGFAIRFPDYCLYLSGDGGFGPHFEEIKAMLPTIDLALLEAGQYNADWRFIHLMPEDWRRAAEILAPKAIFPTHHSKYTLSVHPWRDPIRHAFASAKALGIHFVNPEIGEPITLRRGERLSAAADWWDAV